MENFYSSVDGHGLKRTTHASYARRLATVVTVLTRLAQPPACPVISLNFDYLFHVAHGSKIDTATKVN